MAVAFALPGFLLAWLPHGTKKDTACKSFRERRCRNNFNRKSLLAHIVVSKGGRMGSALLRTINLYCTPFQTRILVAISTDIALYIYWTERLITIKDLSFQKTRAFIQTRS
jgi:hypothetical protein